MTVANACRGEASIVVNGQCVVLRPSFSALVAAEAELGSLFELVERASQGRLKIDEIATLFHHLAIAGAPDLSRTQVGEAMVEAGLSGTAPVLRMVLSQILQGR